MVFSDRGFKIWKFAISGTTPDQRYTGTFKFEVYNVLTSEFDKKIDKSAIVQITGQSESDVMSQKGVTDAIEVPTELANSALVELNGGYANIINEDYNINNDYISANTVSAELDTPLPSFKFKFITPSTVEITSYSLYYYYGDGQVTSRSGYIPGVEYDTPNLGSNITKIAVSSVLPDVRYTGIFTLKARAYIESPIARKSEVEAVEAKIDYDDREEVPSYYLENDYLQDKIDTIKNIYRNIASNADIFIFQTDEHWEVNTQHSPALIKYITEKIAIDKLVDGGDDIHNIALYYTTEQNPALDDFTKLRQKTFKGNVFHTIGNHEYLTGVFNNQDMFDGINFGNWHDMDWFSGLYDVVYGDSLKHYYYVDNKQKKVRYIFLSSFRQSDPILRQDEKYWIIGIEEFASAQRTWLQNVALNVENGWTIIVFSHLLSSINPQISGGHCTGVQRYLSADGKEVAKILLQYNGNGEIAAVICGHLHADGVAIIDDNYVGLTGAEATGKSIPEIITTCDAGGKDDSKSLLFGNASELVERDENTINEQAFDVVILDKSAKKISLVRIGAPAFNIFVPDPETSYYPFSGDVEVREVTYGN